MAVGTITGRLAKVDIGGSALAGAMSFTHSGGVRRSIEAPETFDADYIEKLPGMLEGGEMVVTGAITNIDDAVWAALVAKFHAGTTYIHDAAKFFINTTDYYTPEESLSPASNIWLSLCPDAITHEASGVAQITMTFTVSGQLELEQP